MLNARPRVRATPELYLEAPVFELRFLLKFVIFEKR